MKAKRSKLERQIERIVVCGVNPRTVEAARQKAASEHRTLAGYVRHLIECDLRAAAVQEAP